MNDTNEYNEEEKNLLERICNSSCYGISNEGELLIEAFEFLLEAEEGRKVECCIYETLENYKNEIFNYRCLSCDFKVKITEGTPFDHGMRYCTNCGSFIAYIAVNSGEDIKYIQCQKIREVLLKDGEQ